MPQPTTPAHRNTNATVPGWRRAIAFGFTNGRRRLKAFVALALMTAVLHPVMAIALESAESNIQAMDPPTAQPLRRSVIRLRRGPYFPSLEAIAPTLPEPVLPEAVHAIELVVRLGRRRVYVYQGDTVKTSFPIAVGRPGWETPVGRYTIDNMQENPAWENPFTGGIIPPGANNPLGDRWIGFWSDGKNVIGFHGTPNEGSVGRAASHGCIRMFNRDVRALYAIAEVGMTVIVEQ